MLTVRYFNAAGAFSEATLDGSLFHPVFADSFGDPTAPGFRLTQEIIEFSRLENGVPTLFATAGANLGHDIAEGGILTADSQISLWRLGYRNPVMELDFAPPIPRDGGISSPGRFPMPIFDAFDAGATLIGNIFANFLQGRGAADRLIGDLGNDVLNGLGGADRLFGGGDADILRGAVGNDLLFGDDGDDYLAGGSQNDYLAGGRGADRMVGGPGRDFFALESAVAARGDAILDFVHGLDHIALDGIDADPTRPGDQTFRFIGKAGFSGAGAELRYRDGHLTADLDGDGLRDFHLTIANVPALTAADFLL